MAPLTAVALTAAGIGAGIALARLTTRGLDWLLTTALERRDALVTRALTDPDDLDREYELLTAHHPDDGQCVECGSPWPCIPARALGIGTETP